MTDGELLAALVDQLFESREEAEHVAGCSMCDVHGTFGVSGPYRCMENPVEIERRAEDERRREASRVVWALIDFAIGITPERAQQIEWSEAMRAMSEQIRTHYIDSLRQQIVHEQPLSFRMTQP